MNLLLTSNGLEGNIANVLPKLLKKPMNENNVLFVTTAAYGEDNDTSWLEKYREELRHAGLKNIIDIDLRDKTQQELEILLHNADVVFVNGGNTFFLLYYVKKSGFDKAITRFLDKGKIYIGVSAGSIICGPTIETASYDLGGEYTEDKNIVDLNDLSGFSYVPFLISPHFREEYKHLIQNQTQHASLPIVFLTDEQALLVQNSTITLLGEGKQVQLENVKSVSLPKYLQ